jgi:hypothetical protein
MTTDKDAKILELETNVKVQHEMIDALMEMTRNSLTTLKRRNTLLQEASTHLSGDDPLVTKIDEELAKGFMGGRNATDQAEQADTGRD